jgi:hypothetical protein
VSHPFVGKLRAELAARDERLTGHVSSERTYTTKHGTVTTMDTSKIGARKAARRRVRPVAPTPLSADAQEKRRWSYLTVGWMQVLMDFAHSGGMAPLLKVWTPEERAQAKAALAMK